MTNPTPHGQVPASSAVLKAIREANMQLVRTGDDAFMLVPYKVATAEQAAPKAAPTRTALPEGWTDCTIEFGNDGPEVVAYGPKRMMTRLAKWLGKYFAQVIADAATKAAPQQEAQEPAFWMNEKGHTWSHSDWKQFPKHRAKYPIPLYPHFPAPQPAPACHHRPPCAECASLTAQGGK